MAKSQKDKFKRVSVEQTLREHVVQTKIAGTLRNEKGTTICETGMTLYVIWG